MFVGYLHLVHEKDTYLSKCTIGKALIKHHLVLALQNRFGPSFLVAEILVYNFPSIVFDF